MARFAIVTATIPSSTGVVSYTSSSITGWNNGGLALILTSGNTATPTEGGRVCCSFVSSDGEQGTLAGRSLQGATNIPHNCATVSTADAIHVIDDDQLPGAGTWARAAFSAALSNGVSLDWTNVSGVSGRTFNVVVVLITGLSGVDLGNGAGTTLPGFEPDGVLALGVVGSFNAAPTVASHFQAAFGAAINAATDTQAAGSVTWEINDDPASADSMVRTDRLSIDYDPTTDSETGTAVTGYTSTGFTESGTGGRFFAAYKWTDFIDTAVAVESLSGSGAQSFTGLGITPSLIFGLITGNDTTGSNQTGAARSRCAYFVSDGTNTYSISASQRHTGTLIAVGNATAGSSRYSASAIECLDHDGNVDFSATVTGFTATGFNLSVANAMDGRMVVWAIGQDDAFLVADETEEITDGVVLMGARALVVNETVEITDGFVGFTNRVILGADPQGTAFQASSSRGTALQGGAVAGTTLE